MEQLGLATSLRRGVIEFCVLALLRDRARYGVELVRELANVQTLATTEGTLYPLLSRLRRAGWVSTSWRESPAGPPRRYYTLTHQGVTALEHFRAEWAAFRTAVDRIVATETETP